MQYRVVSPHEQKCLKKWARENYKPFSMIDGRWHPIVQYECVAINIENCELVKTVPTKTESKADQIARRIIAMAKNAPTG